MKTNTWTTKFRCMLLWLRRIGIVLGISCVLGSQAAAQTEIVDRIVAIVNDDVISLYDLNFAIKPYQMQIKQMGYDPEKERKMLFKMREDILNELINEKLTDQQVKKYQISISDKAVDNALENIKTRWFAFVAH